MLFKICCHFSEGKRTSSFCFCWLLSAKLWMGKKAVFTRHGKNNPLKLEITNDCSWWGGVMVFERDRGFFCWRILPGAFSDFVWRMSDFWLLLLLTDQPYSNSTQNLLNPGSQSPAGGEGHQRSQRRFPRRAASEEIWRSLI